MNLTNNELQEIRSMYKYELSNVQIQDPSAKLTNSFELAQKYIVDFCKNATVPKFIEVYISSRDLYSNYENSDQYVGACAIPLENKAIIIFSPTEVNTSNSEKLTAALIHELIHLISKAEDFMECLDEEGLTDICSMTIQKEYLHSPEIPFCCLQYKDKVSEIESYIKESSFDTENVVREFLNNRTNRSFIKKNFPQIYKRTLADVFAELF